MILFEYLNIMFLTISLYWRDAIVTFDIENAPYWVIYTEAVVLNGSNWLKNTCIHSPKWKQSQFQKKYSLHVFMHEFKSGVYYKFFTSIQ
jgi:hypothetical protein